MDSDKLWAEPPYEGFVYKETVQGFSLRFVKYKWKGHGCIGDICDVIAICSNKGEFPLEQRTFTSFSKKTKEEVLLEWDSRLKGLPIDTGG